MECNYISNSTRLLDWQKLQTQCSNKEIQNVTTKCQRRMAKTWWPKTKYHK